MRRVKQFFLILSIPSALVMLIVILFLYPGWAYAQQSTYRSFVVHHNEDLPEGWHGVLDSVSQRLEHSGIHDNTLSIKICLKDGSIYPDIIESVAGESFAFAGVDVIIMQSQIDISTGIATRGDLVYDLVTLLSHEAVHCQEYRHQGFWGANPMAGHPVWKWEGFAELVGRGPGFIRNDRDLVQYWTAAEKGNWITLEDETMVHSSYLRFALLSYLCLQANGQEFDAFLDDPRSEVFWIEEMEKLARSVYLES